jgi:hypothetical protein
VVLGFYQFSIITTAVIPENEFWQEEEQLACQVQWELICITCILCCDNTPSNTWVQVRPDLRSGQLLCTKLWNLYCV